MSSLVCLAALLREKSIETLSSGRVTVFASGYFQCAHDIRLLPSLKPIPIKDRLSILFIEKGQLYVLDGAFVVVDKTVFVQTYPWVELRASCWKWARVSRTVRVRLPLAPERCSFG